MKTYINNIIPRIKEFSERLDDVTILTEKHWVLVDEIMDSKTTYIFRSNNELLISKNGRVDKAKWELLGNKSLLIDVYDTSYLFKHEFQDSNILALGLVSINEYAHFVNENEYDGELNSIENIYDFLTKKYLEPLPEPEPEPLPEPEPEIPKFKYVLLKTNKGEIRIKTQLDVGYTIGDSVSIDGKIAPDGKYSNGWPFWWEYIIIKDGKVFRL